MLGMAAQPRYSCLEIPKDRGAWHATVHGVAQSPTQLKWLSTHMREPFDTWYQFSSVQSSHSVMSDSLWPHESQHTRPPCPSPTPGVHSNSHPSSWWCHPAISSSGIPFSSCPQSLLASGSFPMSQLFPWGGQYWVSNMVLALSSKLLSGKELNQIIKTESSVLLGGKFWDQYYFNGPIDLCSGTCLVLFSFCSHNEKGLWVQENRLI